MAFFNSNSSGADGWSSGKSTALTAVVTTLALFVIALVWTSRLESAETRSVAKSARSKSASKAGQFAATGDLYALVVGISRYKEPKIRPLEFAANDAKAFGKLLESQDHLFKNKHTTILINEQATKRAIEKFLTRELRKSGKDDTVVLFFSGHGVFDPENTTDFYFCPYDMELGYYGATAVKMSGLPFLKRVESDRALVIADACHAGGFSEWVAKDLPQNLEVFLKDFRDSTGRIIITSAGPNEQSWELKDVKGKPLKNGVFTHFLINGFRGKADANRDGRVTVNEAYEYAYRLTKAATKGMQHPQFEGRHSGAFPLTFVHEAAPIRRMSRSLIQAVTAGNLEKIRGFLIEQPNLARVRDQKNNSTPLIIAAEQGRPAVLKFLLEQRPEIEARSDSGDTALIAAARRGHVEAVKILLEKGASPNAKNKKGESPLTEASRYGHFDCVNLLLKSGANVRVVNNQGSTALALAAYTGHKRIVELLLAAGSSAATKDFQGRTPLSLASRYGHADVVRILVDKEREAQTASEKSEMILNVMLGETDKIREHLDSGVDVNMPTDSSDTPLTLASGLGYTPVIELLLDRGANVNSKIAYDSTALIWAAHNGQVKAVKTLVERGANVNAKDKGGGSALLYAAQNGHTEIVNLLIEKQARVNSASRSGNTPLLLACAEGHEPVVDRLVRGGASVDRANKQGTTPLMEAARDGYAKIVKLLLRKVKKIDAQDSSGRSALMMAAANGHEEAVAMLLSKGATVDLADRKGDTALFMAARNGRAKIVKRLIRAGADPRRENIEGATPETVASLGGHADALEVLKKALGPRRRQSETGT